MSPTANMLVLGGARSGKSSFAETLAGDSGLEKVYVATAQAGDDEMQLRIRYHQTRRGPEWITIEEPLYLAEAISRESDERRILLVDCLTLWLSNVMHAECDCPHETQRLIAVLQAARGPVVLVSNEIGLGLVPETPLGRQFRDEQGRLNQRIAEAVANVAFVAAGLPLWLKGQIPSRSAHR